MTPRQRIVHAFNELKLELSADELRTMVTQANDLIPHSPHPQKLGWAFVCCLLLGLADELDEERAKHN